MNFLAMMFVIYLLIYLCFAVLQRSEPPPPPLSLPTPTPSTPVQIP